MPDGARLAPKAVIGYAGQLQYGAPLLSVDFAGGEDSFAFGRLRDAGLAILFKTDSPEVEAEKFEKKVGELKRKGFKAPPKGNTKPQRKESSGSTTFVRLADVVAWVELRANGVCELCDQPAPFEEKEWRRVPRGSPHRPSFRGCGADTVENAAGICPNCHRKCHHWERRPEHSGSLSRRKILERQKIYVRSLA